MVNLAQQQVCVVGLGLMGGSLALALRGKVSGLTGIDRDAPVRSRAVSGGFVDRAFPTLSEGIGKAGIVILAAPVMANLRLLRQLPDLATPGALILDLSSSKEAIVAAMNQLPGHLAAVGGHPMCGLEHPGLEAAKASLFRGAPFVLCATQRSDAASIALAITIVEAVGAVPLMITPELHDRAVAHLSHLPYLLAVALTSDYSTLPEAARQLAASGFRDMTRLAASSTEMMHDTLISNRDQVLAAINSAKANIDELARLIESDDPELLGTLEGVAQTRRSWSGR